MQRTDNKARLTAGENRLKDLFVLGLAGDADAYKSFLTELSGHLRAYLRRRLGALPDEVEDLVQETLLAVHNQRHTYDVDRPLTAWVQAIAKFKLVDLLRRRACREALTDPLDDEVGIFAATATESSDARRDVAKLLDGLPDRQRQAIALVKLEGRSVAETARMTGMSESSVKVGIHRGLKALAAKIRNGT